jgi:hypothetical protein
MKHHLLAFGLQVSFELLQDRRVLAFLHLLTLYAQLGASVQFHDPFLQRIEMHKRQLHQE